MVLAKRIVSYFFFSLGYVCALLRSILEDPPDDVFRDTLLTYSRHALTQDQKLARLRVDHQLSIG